jgi:hypothetical protein
MYPKPFQKHNTNTEYYQDSIIPPFRPGVQQGKEEKDYSTIKYYNPRQIVGNAYKTGCTDQQDRSEQ